MMEGSGVKNVKGDSDTKPKPMDMELTEVKLEDMLACLSLSDGQTSKPIPEQERGSLQFPLSVQNDLRLVFKEFIGHLLVVDADITSERSVDFSTIHNILQEPLLKSLEQPGSVITVNDSDISCILSYLKLLSEVCTPAPAPTRQPTSEDHSNKDVFWAKVVEPILEGILNFLKQLVLKRCIVNLSKSTTTLTESSNGVTSTSHHGTGFAFHQQLGLLHKGVRILLVYMKRATSNLTSDNLSTEYKDRKEKLDQIILEILQELCILMKPLTSREVKTDFDIGLDIRCNIGVGICYCTYFLKHSNKAYIERFFRRIFDSSGERPPLKFELAIEEVIEDLASSDVNRIALGFGILNTWLEQEHDATLYLAIGKNVLDIQHGVKEAVNLGSSRVMEIWTDKLSRASVPSSVLHHVSTLFAPLEFFSFMYMPGHIDAVKNCCRNIIHSLSRIYDRLDEEKFPSFDKKQTWVTGFLQTILEKPAHIKWMALACVAKNTKKALKALELDAALPENLLTVQRALKSAANDTYVALMSYHFQNTSDHATWDKTWIHPLFLTQEDLNNKVSNWPQKRSIISIILNSEKQQLKTIQVMVQPLLRSVVKRMNSSSDGSTVNQNISTEEAEDNLAEASLLAAETIKMALELKISINIKELNLNVSDSSEDSFRGLVPRSLLHDWLWGENPQIRLAGLSLIIETKKTSEEISEQDFGSLKKFLKYNLHSQSPAFRQQFTSYFKKFVRRLKDGENFAHRKKNETVFQRYQDFFRWLWDFLTEKQGLFPGANFGRRCQALECLSELTQHFLDFKIFGVTDSNTLKYLRWLTDSYENNKIQAMQVLVAMPMKEFQDEQFCKNLFNEAATLCKSVKPPDSVTGRYLMTLLMKKCSKFNIYNDSYSAYAILELLYSELEKIYKTAEASSLIAIASESPFYGCIRCIRMILQHTNDYKQAENSAKYREYTNKLLKLCFGIDGILFPVLGSAAPEGFLPGLKDSAPEETKQVVRSMAAQMLLVCAWRSMKETCLLMADMCTWFQIEGESSSSTSHSAAYLLTFKEVSEIGDHLLYLLKNLMHRGVFEQVFVGFKQLASRLWKSTSPALNNLPEKWLQEAMDQEHISSKSITRRSAGLPFIFQALLSAECDNESFLHKWVQRLLILDESPDISPTRIHSMNVLRGLFRDACFSAAMMPFVPQGLKMAFRGLKSSDWTERNSGLMLYGAVMRRSFGAKLNLMNAPTFFRKFPQMYDFLLEELDICIKLMERRQKERDIFKTGQAIAKTEEQPQLTCDFTFHLLLLLSSFTASCRIEDTHFKLDAFIPRIRKCGESDDMEVRKLSAKALVSFLVSPEDKRQLMLTILHEMEFRNELLSQNQLHGKLFQLLTISAILVREDSVICKDANVKIATAFLSLLSSEPTLKSFHAPTIFEVLMSILVSLNSLGCLKKQVIGEKGVNVVLKTFGERFGHISLNRNFIPGLLVADKMVANGAIQIMKENFDSKTFVEVIYNYFVDCTLSSIPFIDEFLELFQEDDYFCKPIFGGEETDNVPVVVIVEAVLENYLRRISSEFRKFPATIMELNYLKLLEAAPPSIFTNVEERITKCMIDRLFELCDESNTVECTSLQIRAAAFRILGNIIFTTGIPVSQEYQTILCDMAVKWSASVADDDMRMAVAQSYPNVPFDLMGQFSEVNQAKLWASIFMLTQDDESYIRQLLGRKLTATTGRPVCDRKSIEILMSLYFKHFLIHNPLEGFIVLLGLLQRSDFEFEVKADDETEDRLFDKSEMNMYFEHEILTKVILKEMSEDCSGTGFKVKDVGNAKLTADQVSLYNFLVNTQLVDKTDLSGMSLRNLCSQTEVANRTNVVERVGLALVINDDSSCLIDNCVQDILNTL